jgi:hypothetical protein
MLCSLECAIFFQRKSIQSINRFIRLYIKCNEVENFLNEKCLCSVVFHHTFNYDPGSGGSVPEDLPAQDTF